MFYVLVNNIVLRLQVTNSALYMQIVCEKFCGGGVLTVRYLAQINQIAKGDYTNLSLIRGGVIKRHCEEGNARRGNLPLCILILFQTTILK